MLYHVTFPLLLPALISSATLAFAFSFTSMGVVLVLGGPQFATMEVAIYELTTKLFRLPLAAALSVVQLVFTYAVLIIYTTFQEKVSVRLNVQPREVTVHRGLNAAQRVFVGAMFVYVLVLLSPLVALLFRFFSETNGHISSYLVSLFLDEGESYFYLSSPLVIWNSVKFAFFTVLISMVVGVALAYLRLNVYVLWYLIVMELLVAVRWKMNAVFVMETVPPLHAGMVRLPARQMNAPSRKYWDV